MTTFQVSDEVAQIARKTAAAAGYSEVDDYIADLICQSEPINQELEAELLKAISEGSREIGPAEWEAKRQALRDRISASKQ